MATLTLHSSHGNGIRSVDYLLNWSRAWGSATMSWLGVSGSQHPLKSKNICYLPEWVPEGEEGRGPKRRACLLPFATNKVGPLLPAPCSLLLAPCSPCSPCSCAPFLANPNPAFNLLVFKYLHKQDLYLYPSKNIQSRKFIVLFPYIECEVYYLCHRQVFLVSSSFFVTLLLCLSRHPSTPSLKYIQFLPTT